jgi:hypothetical protein
VTLQCPAGHPPAEPGFGISQWREDNEADTSRHQVAPDVPGRDPLARAAADWTASAKRWAPGETWAQIASALHNPSSPIAQRTLRTANYITAAVCKTMDGRASGVC